MIHRNLLANYLSAGWIGLMSFAFLPAYARLLGVEAIGLIGLFTIMQGWFLIFDMGLSHTINREMARFLAGLSSRQQVSDLLRTTEIIFWSTGILISTLLAFSSDWLARNWLLAETLPVDDVSRAILIASIALALRWICVPYRSTLLGLQNQIWLSISNAAFSTLKSAGVIIFLGIVPPSIQGFFGFQALIALLELVILFRKAKGAIPAPPKKPVFALDALKAVRRFALGVALVTVSTTTLIQADKLLISMLLPLAEYGHFILAMTMVGALSLLVDPLANVAYPRFSAIVQNNNDKVLAEQYHEFCHLLACMVVPAALILSIFSREVVFVWTGDPDLADAVAPGLQIWVLGTALHGLTKPAYFAQLAHGWTRLALLINGFSLLIFFPALLFLVPRFGVVGAAWAWLGIGVGHVLLGVPAMFKRVLKGHQMRWCVEDVLLPIAAGCVPVVGFVLVRPWWTVADRMNQFFVLCFASFATLVVVAMATPTGRRGARLLFARLRSSSKR